MSAYCSGATNSYMYTNICYLVHKESSTTTTNLSASKYCITFNQSGRYLIKMYGNNLDRSTSHLIASNRSQYYKVAGSVNGNNTVSMFMTFVLEAKQGQEIYLGMWLDEPYTIHLDNIHPCMYITKI